MDAFERMFVRTQNGWQRRPPDRINFFDVITGEDADPLALLRQIAGPATYVACRPPEDAGMFATARAGLERHVGAITAERGNVRLETVDANHGVIFEKAHDIAAMVASFVAP